MKTTERQKLHTIRFIYGVTSKATRERAEKHDWAPTVVFVRIVSPEAARDPARAENHPGTVGEATVYLYDLAQMDDQAVCIIDEMDSYCKSTSRLGNLLCPDDQPVTEKFCNMLNRAFKTNISKEDIRRIAYVERRTTKAKYRGNNISSLFYDDIFRVLSPDVILTYPFPLQYEGKNTLASTGKEFKLSFFDSMKKLKAIYRKAGMRNIGSSWMAMPNPRFTNLKNKH